MGWFSVLQASQQAAQQSRTSALWGPLPLEYAHEWALVDVETSGLRAGSHRVLQLAVITVDAYGQQTGEFVTLLDPGCDPGPVHVHGLTRERLSGAPTFEQVAPRVAELLQGRTLVAHNAGFDYDFLRHEFVRAGSVLPVQRRLCTLALNRSLGTPAPNLKLGTLAAYYRVPQQRAHDALDDTRVLAGILRHSLAAAVPLGLSLPFVMCPPKQAPGFAPNIPKSVCAFTSPGRWAPGRSLMQGMKVALTGETALAREDLIARGVSAGLNMMSNVSRHTSILVTNVAGSGSTKAERARAEGVPVIDEASFVALLANVAAGNLLDQQVPAKPHPAPRETGGTAGAFDGSAAGAVGPASSAGSPAVSGPLTGRRVLVLGGDHEARAEARARVAELGGVGAVNLSAGVTDVVALADAVSDKRWSRIVSLAVPVRDEGWLQAPTSEETRPEVAEGGLDPSTESLPAALPEPMLPVARVLVRGQAVDLPAAGRWTVTTSWAASEPVAGGAVPEVDVVAFILDGSEQVTGDDGMVFYNNPTTLGGAVTLTASGPSEQTVAVDLDAVPGWVQRVAVAAAIDPQSDLGGGQVTFGQVGAVAVSVGPGEDAPVFAEATLDAATVERSLSLLELYRRGTGWRVRPVGQGWESGLLELAVLYGVDVEE